MNEHGKTKKRKAHNRTKGSGSLYQRGRIWWMAASTPYGSFRESTGKEGKGEAQAVLTAKLAAVQTGTVTASTNKTTVADLVAYVIDDYTKNKQKSLKDVKHRWELHLEPFFRQHRAAQVTPDSLEKYKTRRIEEGAENGTINRELAVLRRGFHIGLKRGKVTRIPHFEMLAESKPREGFLEAEQYQRLTEACSRRAPWLRAFVEVAGQLSNRRGELLNMRVRDVDFAAGRFGVITLADTKNGERRKVPLTQSVRALLEIACAGKRADDCVFTWQDGRQVRDFRTMWKAVCTEAGVPDLKVHDLRRTGIRNMIRRGVAEQIAMKISGHKTVSVFRRYNITSDEDLHNAAALIEAGRSQFTDAVQSEQEPQEVMIN